MSEKTKIEWCDHTFNPVRGCTKVSPGCENCYAAREAVRFPAMRGVWGNAGTRIVAVPDAWKEPRRWNDRKGFCVCPTCGADMPAQLQKGSGIPLVVDMCPNGCAAPPRQTRRPRVFCASLADVFEDWKGDLRFPAEIAPKGWVTARWDGRQLIREFEDGADRQGLARATMDDLRTELFHLIEETPNLDWLLLTKRPGNVMRMMPESWRARFPRNVWMGTTVEDQKRADERIPELLKIPAKVRFLSCEPLLGPVDLNSNLGGTRWIGGQRGCMGQHHGRGTPDCPRELHHHHDERCKPGIEWVIAGGESGSKARPIHPDWARSLRDQCRAAAVPFFFKQWGEWAPQFDADGKPLPYMIRGKEEVFPDHPDHPGADVFSALLKVGKKAAGRLLDGREWNEFPTPEKPTPQR